MSRILKEPHIFNASSNPIKLIKNLRGIISEDEILKIEQEINNNVIKLYALGVGHYNFAKRIAHSEWRQKISRLYYAAYNIRRSIQLKADGHFSMDSSDHQRVGEFPDKLNNKEKYKQIFISLREDRNLSDYSHLAVESDLIQGVSIYESSVTDFVNDAKEFLLEKGVSL
ncbi:hypothetical protein [Sphaerotilus montanus]|uniref:hypothetical protein n=1 Tax=Sphaerotilus montanus TaxID=522889 RepID=UPI003FA2E5A4